ncbi:MAG: four-carbon acid sugar kinase family protein [Gammaproteobacteria bacterium]|nr:four-carbon acid sugar kinase family protein [Gammaproteobacteria bacterium]
MRGRQYGDGEDRTLLELGVIADDLTGGVKVASLLEEQGVRCPVATSADAVQGLPGDVQAVVVGRKLLSRPAGEAVADAKYSARALLAQGAKQLYYKYSTLFCSTARGNIGPVAEALMDMTHTDRVLFCPGRPERSATVYQGRLFLGTDMLHETPRRYDPVTPMTNSNLVEVLQSQSRVEVGLLNHDTMRAGRAACERYLAEQSAAGVRFFIVDVIDPGDLARVAALASDSALVTGSDDLPVALSRGWRNVAATEPRTLLPAAPGHAAVISGSCTPRTSRQLARFEAVHPVYRIDLLKAASDERGVLGEAVEWACARLVHGPVGVATTTDAEGVKRAQAELGQEGASALADDLLGRMSRALYELGVRKFVVAGGETSGSVIRSLGIERLEVGAHDDLQGGYCHRADDDPLSLVVKSGSAGEDDFIGVALERMRMADAASG